MVDKRLNEFDLAVPALDDHFLFQQGNLAENPTLRGTPESLNQLFLGERIVPVYQESDIGIAVMGELFLADNTTYFIYAPIVTFNTWVLGNNTGIVDPGRTQNAITFLGSTAIKVVDLTSNQISNIRFFSDGVGTQLFDINSASAGNFSLDRVLTVGFASLGNVNDVSCAWQRIGMLNFGQGFTFNGGTFIGVNFSRFTTPAVTTIFDVSGTFSDAISFTSLNCQTGVGGFAFDLDNALVAPQVRTRDIGLLGGVMFDPTGLDGKAVNVQASGLDGVKDSQVLGIMSMVDNVTVTTIPAIDTAVSIAGVTVAGSDNERITHSGNIFTYIGKQKVIASIHADMSGVAAASTSLYNFCIYKNGALVPNAITQNELTNRTVFTAIQFQVPIVMNDTIEIKVLNPEGSTNLTITHMTVTLEASV